MIDSLRPRRTAETFELTCWRCNRFLEVPVNAPHRCPACHELLLIEWAAIFCAAPRRPIHQPALKARHPEGPFND
jgi:hypothetical protein